MHSSKRKLTSWEHPEEPEAGRGVYPSPGVMPCAAGSPMAMAMARSWMSLKPSLASKDSPMLPMLPGPPRETPWPGHCSQQDDKASSAWRMVVQAETRERIQRGANLGGGALESELP